MVNIYQGADKDIIIRVNSGDTLDPYDLTGVTKIEACFTKTDGTYLDKYYLLLSGSMTNGSVVITGVDTTLLKVGMPIKGANIPLNSTIVAVNTTLNTIDISAPVTATATVPIEITEVMIVSAIIGKIKIQLHEEDTSILESGEGKNFEVTIVKNGFTSIIQFKEALNVVEKLCL